MLEHDDVARWAREHVTDQPGATMLLSDASLAPNRLLLRGDFGCLCHSLTLSLLGTCQMC